jgi:MFS family permease
MTPLERRASLSLASIYALRMLGLFSILPVFAVHAASLPGGQNQLLVGVAIGIYGLTQGLLQIPFGLASDRLGRKPVIVGGLLVFAAGSFIAALAQDLPTVIVGRALQGAGAVSAAVTAFIADSTRDEVRTKAMALVGGSISLTFAISLIAVPMVFPLIGMGGLFTVVGALTLAGVAVVLWVTPEAPPKPKVASPPWPEVVFNPELLRLNLGIFTLHLVQMAMFVAIPVALVQQAGLALPQHGWVYLPVVVLSFVLMLPPLMWSERRGRIRAVFLASVVALAVTLGALAVAWQSVGVLLAALLVFFTGFNLLEAQLPSLVSRMAPPAAKGLALGVYNTTQALGLFGGGLLGGWLAKAWGFGAVFGVCAALLAVWAVVAWPMRPPHAVKAAAPLAGEPPGVRPA